MSPGRTDDFISPKFFQCPSEIKKAKLQGALFYFLMFHYFDNNKFFILFFILKTVGDLPAKVGPTVDRPRCCKDLSGAKFKRVDVHIPVFKGILMT